MRELPKLLEGPFFESGHILIFSLHLVNEGSINDARKDKGVGSLKRSIDS